MEHAKNGDEVNHTHLKNIAEVTEEYNTTIKQRPKEQAAQKIVEPIKNTQNLITKYKKCLRYMLSFCYKGKTVTEYDVNQSEITKQVEKIKKRKIKIQPLLPQVSPNTKTLILDLDETLIHTSFKKTKNYDFSIEIDVRGQKEKVYVSKRFGLDIFLFEMSQIYQIVVFTVGLKEYSDQVINFIDPKKRIKHALYREHCTVLNKSYFIKNLQNLGRNLKQTILVDDNSTAGMMQPEIFYKIEPFYGNPRDRKLLRLIEFLKQMSSESNFQCLLQKRKQFEKKNLRPCSALKHNINSQAMKIAKSESTQQSSCLTEQCTAVEMVKNIEEL